ncbi:hypothetical protein LguiA_007308 [Lonicera macranthoides]
MCKFPLANIKLNFMTGYESRIQCGLRDNFGGKTKIYIYIYIYKQNSCLLYALLHISSGKESQLEPRDSQVRMMRPTLPLLLC